MTTIKVIEVYEYEYNQELSEETFEIENNEGHGEVLVDIKLFKQCCESPKHQSALLASELCFEEYFCYANIITNNKIIGELEFTQAFSLQRSSSSDQNTISFIGFKINKNTGPLAVASFIAQNYFPENIKLYLSEKENNETSAYHFVANPF